MTDSIRIDANNAGKMMIPIIQRASLSDLIYWLQLIGNDQFYGSGHDGMNKLVYEARVAHEIRREIKRRDQFYIKQGEMPHRSIIEAIKQRGDIPSVIEQFTDVFKHRGKWTYRCPLHQDRTPSGIIDNEGYLHCFSCGFHGDVIDAVAALGKTDKRGAIKWLCQFYGIKPDVLPMRKVSPSKEKYYNALE